MNTTLKTSIASLACILASGITAQAGIGGINPVPTSFSTIVFDDTNSFAPTPGITNINPTVTPWGGGLHTLALTTDPVTLDTAQGDIWATFGGNTYNIALANVALAQVNPIATGFAILDFQFRVEFQVDAFGLPAGNPTYSPTFSVSGTVQPGGFAGIGGQIRYHGVNSAGMMGLIDTVNYNTLWTTPGPFFAPAVSGVAVNGTTPILPANSTLVMEGSIHFLVDPASINAQTVNPIPEPTGVLTGLLCLGIAGMRRRRR